MSFYEIITLNFYDYLNDDCYINSLLTNKLMYSILNENNYSVYRILLYSKFSREFVDRAQTIIINWKDCYFRIRHFEYLMNKYHNELWCEYSYYTYWDYLEKIKKLENEKNEKKENKLQFSHRDYVNCYRRYYANYYKNNF